MTWCYGSVDYKVYARNSLVSTDIELRFQQILGIVDDPVQVSRLQEKLRADYPEYKKIQARGISLTANGDVVVNDEIQHVFSKGKGSVSLTLGPQSLRASTTKHRDRISDRECFIRGYNALVEVFGRISPTRIGVRYVNIIDKQAIASDLGLVNQSLQWQDVINKSFLNAPDDIVHLSEANFHCEVESKHPNGGGLSLRYGLNRADPASAPVFRFDVDRYIVDPPQEGNLSLCLEDLVQDIFSLFHTVMGEKLKQWMSVEEAQ